MIVFLNGEYVPEERAMISIFDRCFRYGDGLFEAILVANGRLFRWVQHAARLEHSAEFLKIALPFSRADLFRFATELIAVNQMPDAALRIQLSRGVGPRGYAPTGEEKPFIVMTLHPAPPRDALVQWKLTLCSFRVAANDPLPNHKTCSRLLQVLAAAEARERGADECLLVNTNGEITEGGSSNMFWIENETVCTPPLEAGALPGVTRAATLERCEAIGIATSERTLHPEQLGGTDGVFLSLTTRGIVEGKLIDDKLLARSPLTKRLHEDLQRLIVEECR